MEFHLLTLTTWTYAEIAWVRLESDLPVIDSLDVTMADED